MDSNPDRKFIFMDSLTVIRPSTVKGKLLKNKIKNNKYIWILK